MQLLQASGLCSPVWCWNLFFKYNSDPFVPIFSFCVGFCRPSNYNSFPLQGAMTAGLGMDRSEPGAGDKQPPTKKILWRSTQSSTSLTVKMEPLSISAQSIQLLKEYKGLQNLICHLAKCGQKHNFCLLLYVNCSSYCFEIILSRVENQWRSIVLVCMCVWYQ